MAKPAHCPPESLLHPCGCVRLATEADNQASGTGQTLALGTRSSLRHRWILPKGGFNLTTHIAKATQVLFSSRASES